MHIPSAVCLRIEEAAPIEHTVVYRRRPAVASPTTIQNKGERQGKNAASEYEFWLLEFVRVGGRSAILIGRFDTTHWPRFHARSC